MRMMRNERKNVLAALLLAATLLVLPASAQAKGWTEGLHDTAPGRHWVVRILNWLGLHPQGIGSIWEASSAHIDPDGQP